MWQLLPRPKSGCSLPHVAGPSDCVHAQGEHCLHHDIGTLLAQLAARESAHGQCVVVLVRHHSDTAVWHAAPPPWPGPDSRFSIYAQTQLRDATHPDSK